MALQVTLIDDLLDISRIITGKLVVEREPVPLVAVVTGAIESERPAAEAAGVTLSCRIGEDERPVVGDSARLQQVVTNLLSNAIKFTPRGGPPRNYGRIRAPRHPASRRSTPPRTNRVAGAPALLVAQILPVFLLLAPAIRAPRRPRYVAVITRQTSNFVESRR